MDIQLLQSLITAIFVSASASLLGSFVILKRMALVGDALSHVALPGMALGLLLNFNPFVGAFALLFIAITGVWLLKNKTHLPIDTLIGIFFTASLAIGVLIIPEHDLLEAMFGNITTLSLTDSIILIAISIILIISLLLIYKKLTLNLLSEDLSHSVGIKNKFIDFIYLLIFATAVAIGIRFVGALLMGSLVIIPAASAKNISKSLKGFMALSVIFGILATIIGVVFSHKLQITPGPIFIISSAIIFIISLLIRWVKR